MSGWRAICIMLDFLLSFLPSSGCRGMWRERCRSGRAELPVSVRRTAAPAPSKMSDSGLPADADAPAATFLTGDGAVASFALGGGTGRDGVSPLSPTSTLCSGCKTSGISYANSSREFVDSRARTSFCRRCAVAFSMESTAAGSCMWREEEMAIKHRCWGGGTFAMQGVDLCVPFNLIRGQGSLAAAHAPSLAQTSGCPTYFVHCERTTTTPCFSAWQHGRVPYRTRCT